MTATPADTHSHDNSTLQRVQDLVLAMPMAQTLGLRFVHVAPGDTELEMPIAEHLSFRPGQLQASAIFALGDFAAVSAAASLLPAGWVNATVDGSIKLFAPARGSHLRARGHVIDSARLLSVCAADLYAVAEDGTQTLCATWLGTARNLEARPAQA